MRLQYFIFLQFIVLVLFQSSNAQTCLEGNCINGNGKFKFKNGDIYTGSFSNGKMNGKGSLIYINGDVYNGQFINGVRAGFGSFTFENGAVFNGAFKQNVGKGKLKDVFNNSIVGNLTEGNLFVEDRIAFDNLIAKIKKSLAFVTSQQFNETTCLFYDIDKFVCGYYKISGPSVDTIKATFTFSDGRILPDVKVVLLHLIQNEHLAFFQIVHPFNGVIPYEIDVNHGAMAHTKIMKMAGDRWTVLEGQLLQNGNTLYSDIVRFGLGKQCPIFNRSGLFLGIVSVDDFFMLDQSWLPLMGL